MSDDIVSVVQNDITFTHAGCCYKPFLPSRVYVYVYICDSNRDEGKKKIHADTHGVYKHVYNIRDACLHVDSFPPLQFPYFIYILSPILEYKIVVVCVI